MALTPAVRSRRFVAKRLVRSLCTQKQTCRAHQGLSIIVIEIFFEILAKFKT